jgi:hypothetical protein
LGVTFFGLGHSQQNGSAFFIRFAASQFPISLRGLNLGAPVALHDFNLLSSILLPIGP